MQTFGYAVPKHAGRAVSISGGFHASENAPPIPY